MLIVILVIAALGTLVFTGLTTSVMEAEIAGRTIEASQAFYHADTGVEHALDVIIATDRGLGDDLLGPDGVEGTEDDGYVLGTTPVPFGDGTYIARLVNNWEPGCTGNEDSDSDPDNDSACDEGSDDEDGDSDDDGVPDPVDSDGIAHLWVLGTSGDSVAAIRATVDVTAGAGGGPGIYTNGTIYSGSGSEVTAADATVHGNAGLDLARNSSIIGAPGTSGRARIAQGTTIDDRALSSEEARAYEDEHSGLDEIDIPEIRAADYAHLADYRLTADGEVYDSSGDLVGEGDWNSWSFAAGEWKLQSVKDDYLSAALYFETDVYVSAQDDVDTSIIAEGSVQMTGSRMRAAKEDLLIVTDGDVKLTGNADSTAYVGNVYAREQISTDGTSGLRGNLVAQDAASDHRLVRGPPAIRLSSVVVVDPGLVNSLMQEAAGITEWFVDQRGRYREVFR